MESKELFEKIQSLVDEEYPKGLMLFDNKQKKVKVSNELQLIDRIKFVLETLTGSYCELGFTQNPVTDISENKCWRSSGDLYAVLKHYDPSVKYGDVLTVLFENSLHKKTSDSVFVRWNCHLAHKLVFAVNYNSPAYFYHGWSNYDTEYDNLLGFKLEEYMVKYLKSEHLDSPLVAVSNG